MLLELRKYALGIVATTQFSSRLDDTVREALFGNVGTIISFRVGATDAAILAKQFGSDVPEPRDLVGLANYEFFVKLMIDGTQSKPFSARTLPLGWLISAKSLKRLVPITGLEPVTP
jgi:DNA helicase HerA-like ATPase